MLSNILIATMCLSALIRKVNYWLWVDIWLNRTVYAICDVCRGCQFVSGKNLCFSSATLFLLLSEIITWNTRYTGQKEGIPSWKVEYMLRRNRNMNFTIIPQALLRPSSYFLPPVKCHGIMITHGATGTLWYGQFAFLRRRGSPKQNLISISSLIILYFSSQLFIQK